MSWRHSSSMSHTTSLHPAFSIAEFCAFQTCKKKRRFASRLRDRFLAAFHFAPLDVALALRPLGGRKRVYAALRAVGGRPCVGVQFSLSAVTVTEQNEADDPTTQPPSAPLSLSDSTAPLHRSPLTAVSPLSPFPFIASLLMTTDSPHVHAFDC